MDLLLHTYASPAPKELSFSGVKLFSSEFAFWIWRSQAGELNLCRITWGDSSISAVGTDGGSCEATRMLVAAANESCKHGAHAGLRSTHLM